MRILLSLIPLLFSILTSLSASASFPTFSNFVAHAGGQGGGIIFPFTNSSVVNTLTNGLIFYSRMDGIPPLDIIANTTISAPNPGSLGVGVSGVAFQDITAGGNTSGEMLKIPDSFFNFGRSFTVSFWVCNNGVDWSGYRTFIDKSDIFDGFHHGFLTYYQSDAGTFTTLVGNGSSLFSVSSSLGTPDAFAWYQISVRLNTTNRQIILGINGTAFTNITTYTGTLATNDSELNIFNPVGGTGNGFGGSMDEFAIYNRALSDHELRLIYGAGKTNHVGFPFTQQLTNVYWVLSARGLNGDTLQTMFQRESWVSNHLSITNVIPSISMYVTTNAGWGDAVYGSLAEQIRTNFPSYTGTRTNGFVIFSPGIENDIIVLNGGGVNFTITNVVISMSNSVATLISRGYKVLAVTCADTTGFTAEEEAWRSYANQWMTNLPGISGFVDVDTFIAVGASPDPYDGSGSEFSVDGRTNMIQHINAKATQVW